MLTLNELASLIPNSALVGQGGVELHGATDDSRKVKAGYAFVAVSGENFDGHKFIDEALKNGASAVIAERRLDNAGSIPLLIVSNSRKALACCAAAFCGWPGRTLRTIGVTGTNGKSTSVHMMRSILNAAGHSAGVLGTIEYSVGSQVRPSYMTTPGPVDLQQMLATMVMSGVEYCAMEASSHALDQHRTDGVDFSAAIFTNITKHEHLDYHGSFENYLCAKKRLFEGLGRDSSAAINIEDPNAKEFIAASHCNIFRYGLGEDADVRAHLVRAELSGTQFEVSTPAGSTQISAGFVGMHNLSNALGAIAASVGLGIGLDAIKEGLEECTVVPGRLDPVDCGQNFNLFVDYAHTDDALRSVLSSLRSVVQGRLIVVFGCGGDRDPSKRSRMGSVAERFADISILTADNSRSERTQDIIEQICEGFTGYGRYEICPDRRVAIRRAIEIARPGDTVVIAGKGHESTQTIRGEERKFDDRKVARALLSKHIEDENVAVPAVQ